MPQTILNVLRGAPSLVNSVGVCERFSSILRGLPTSEGWGPLIEVSAGMGEQSIRFAVHANLLTTQSLFFAQRLQNNHDSSIESSTTVELPSNDPNIFDLILTWIYTRQLPHAGVDDDCCGIRDNCLLLSCESSKVQLIKLYLMAEVLGVESLMTVITNVVIEFTIRAFIWPFSPAQIALLWQRVPAHRKMSTGLRRLLVDFFALTRRTGIRDFGPNTEGCGQFLFEVGCLRERSYNLGLPFWDKKAWISQGNWCKKYHEHFALLNRPDDL